MENQPKYKPGDLVAYTNGYGFLIGTRTIKSSTKITYDKSGFGYYITPTDTPWFAVGENQLKLINQ